MSKDMTLKEIVAYATLLYKQLDIILFEKNCVFTVNINIFSAPNVPVNVPISSVLRLVRCCKLLVYPNTDL